MDKLAAGLAGPPDRLDPPYEVVMPDPYAVLGVPADADDGAIRRRYLELARQFPPEQHPARFAAVRSAYEQVKDVGGRARHRLFGAGKDDGADAAVEEAACRTPRRRIGLADLIAALP